MSDFLSSVQTHGLDTQQSKNGPNFSFTLSGLLSPDHHIRCQRDSSNFHRVYSFQPAKTTATLVTVL